MVDNWKEIEAEWKYGSSFIGHNKSGGEVQMGALDGKPGVSPMELILIGLAGCTGMDIVDIMGKKREPLTGLKVLVRGLRAEDYPKVYKEIEIEYLIWGRGINPKSIERAIALSEEKYCSVSAMLSSVAQIRSTYEIYEKVEI